MWVLHCRARSRDDEFVGLLTANLAMGGGALESVTQHLVVLIQDGQGSLSCKDVLDKRVYRDVLRSGAPDLGLVHLKGTREVLAARAGMRQGHYTPVSLLESQCAILEPPGEDENALTFDVCCAPLDIVQATVAALQASGRLTGKS